VQINKIKIAYVISAALPTSKAYGVTAKETVEVLLKFGYDVKVLANSSKYYDSDFKKIVRVLENYPKSWLISKLLFVSYQGKTQFNMACWRLAIILNLIKSFKILNRFNPHIIWVRDPLVAYIYLKKYNNIKIILEIHSKNGTFLYKKIARFNDRIKYCPINDSNREYITSLIPNIKTCIAPMAIRASNITTPESCKKYVESLKLRGNNNISIGYVGKISPGGYSKGVKDLIYLAEYFCKNSVSASVTIVGADEQNLKKLNREIQELKIQRKYIKILPHVKHSIALKMMKSFDVLVLPRYEDQNYNGMPIKLIEYISTGKISILARTLLYSEIFLGNYKPFYYEPKDINSLILSINSALNSKNLENTLLEGLRFSKEFTWENRTLRILDS
jgi:glycosyltransferase involved in cell wall biosynthesis